MNTCRYISRPFLTSLIFLFSCYICTTCVALCNRLDQDSLLAFSTNISSPSSFPLNWTISIDCCSWEGISCDDRGRVKGLWLPSKGLVGTLSPSLSNLSYLSQLNLSRNRLSGPIPDTFFTSLESLQVVDLSFNYLSGELNSPDSLPITLETLDLSSNEFSGEIRTSILRKESNLMNFNVSDNSFNGPFPLFICDFLQTLTVLDFSFNNFNGPIGFGRCPNLKVLRAGFNLLTGSLPDDIYEMMLLEEINLPGNRLSGSISEGIGNLRNLRILALNDNEFSGPIPQSIGRLNKLEDLLLQRNRLNGTLPENLTNCRRLDTLNLRNNSIMGEISLFDFSGFLQLRIIDLGNNLLRGSFPSTLGSCLSLTAIRLSGNRLVGEIPIEIQALKSLSFLSASNNSLSNIKVALSILSGCQNLTTLALSNNFRKETFPGRGELLFHIVPFKKMELLALGGCQFYGNFPEWFSELKKLKVLDLSQNGFTGEIPGWLWNLPSLFYLDLSQNFFSGILSAEISRLPSLVSENIENGEYNITLELPVFVNPPPQNIYDMQYHKITRLPAIYLKNNKINGNIPTEISQLKLIHELDLSNNNFSGNIPETISGLKNLEKLDLSGNHLQGQIPASFKKLHFLSYFNVANNLLEGPVPTGGQFDTFSITSYGGNSGLCGEVLLRSCSKTFAAPQPLTKKRINWLSFQSGFGFGLGVSFIVTVVNICYMVRLEAAKVPSCIYVCKMDELLNYPPPKGSNLSRACHIEFA